MNFKTNKVTRSQTNLFLKEAWEDFNKEKNTEWDPKDFYYATYLNNKMIASIHLVINGNICTIKQLIVDKNYRREGLGSNLLKKAEETAKNSKCHKISMDIFDNNKEAIKFYKKNKFKQAAKLKKDKFNLTKFIFYKRLK